MQINKNQILTSLKADLANSKTFHDEWRIKVDKYKRETYAKPYGNERKGKSRIVSADIKRQLESMIPSIIDPFVSSPEVFKCYPVTFEDTEAARQNELLLNTQFVRKFNRYNFINKACRVLATEGTVVIQTGWETVEKQVKDIVEIIEVLPDGTEYITEKEVMRTVKVKNQPTAIIRRNEDIFFDPTAMDEQDKMQFVIVRYEADYSTLKKEGKYKNLEKAFMPDPNWDGSYIPEDTTYFKFKDKARKKAVVYEYWGKYDINNDGIVENIVCTWIGDTIIRLEDNPYPNGELPFIIVPFSTIPFQLPGEALAENIGDNQKVKTALIRGTIDNLAASNNGQIGIRQGALNPINKKRFLSGDNFEYAGTVNDFWQGNYNQIPSSVFNVMSLMNAEIESQTGVRSAGALAGNGALGETATAAKGAMDVYAMRTLNIVRNIAENLMKPLARKWMAYNSEFLEPEEVVRVTNSQFVPVRRDDLSGRVDIDITINTAEDNAARRQELSFLLQTLGNTIPFEMTQQILAEIVKLSKNPKLEKEIKEFQPPKDPLQDALKQLEITKIQLENERLKAEIADKYARVDENKVDVELKLRKAEVEAAKARKLNKDADKTELDVIDKNYGFKAQFEAEEKERERQHQVEMAKIQAMLGGPNEQIGVTEK